MKKKETQKLYHSITNIDDKYIQEAQTAKKRRKPIWIKWAAAAACLCVICVSTITIINILKGEQTSDKELAVIPDVWQTSDNELTVVPDAVHPSIEDSEQAAEEQEREQEIFVPIASLLMSGNYGIVETAAFFGKVPIGQYTGVYEKVESVESAVLSENKGSGISGAEEWYYVSGHTDMQYLIRNVNEEYSLWKFSCFENGEYPYSDVLELVYRIDSADAISEIEVNPAKMDNTDGGKAIQEQIGTFKITDRDKIETIYQILSSLTCYGSNHWDKIDYGDTDAPADAEPSHQAVLLGRYLSIVTDYGNEIDGLKYTAVSGMFYEFSGIAYNRLSTEQAESMSDILGITESIEKLQYHDIKEDNQSSEKPMEYRSMEHRGEILIEAENTSVSLDDVTELQNRVSAAMINKDLPFVISSSVYENPYRLHVVVTSNSESDIQKLLELDSMGGVIEIEYAPAGMNKFELQAD